MKARLLEQMEQGVGEHQSWDAKRETDEQMSERIVAEEFRRRRWTEGILKERRKTDPEKVKLAQRLRRESVKTLDWIAERLEMGCRHTLVNCLKAARITKSRD